MRFILRALGEKALHLNALWVCLSMLRRVSSAPTARSGFRFACWIDPVDNLPPTRYTRSRHPRLAR